MNLNLLLPKGQFSQSFADIYIAEKKRKFHSNFSFSCYWRNTVVGITLSKLLNQKSFVKPLKKESKIF